VLPPSSSRSCYMFSLVGKEDRYSVAYPRHTLYFLACRRLLSSRLLLPSHFSAPSSSSSSSSLPSTSLPPPPPAPDQATEEVSKSQEEERAAVATWRQVQPFLQPEQEEEEKKKGEEEEEVGCETKEKKKKKLSFAECLERVEAANPFCCRGALAVDAEANRSVVFLSKKTVALESSIGFNNKGFGPFNLLGENFSQLCLMDVIRSQKLCRFLSALPKWTPLLRLLRQHFDTLCGQLDRHWRAVKHLQSPKDFAAAVRADPYRFP